MSSSSYYYIALYYYIISNYYYYGTQEVGTYNTYNIIAYSQASQSHCNRCVVVIVCVCISATCGDRMSMVYPVVAGDRVTPRCTLCYVPRVFHYYYIRRTAVAVVTLFILQGQTGNRLTVSCALTYRYPTLLTWNRPENYYLATLHNIM